MPFSSPEKKRAYERSRVPRRRAWRRNYARKLRDRKRAERVALATVPPGRSVAIDALRAALRAATDGPTRERLRAALDHAIKLYMPGTKVKPRDPERLRFWRPDLNHNAFNGRGRANAGVLEE